jgi:PAS domain S-box-containing protein
MSDNASNTPTSLQAALQRLELSESRLAEAQEVAHIGSWEWTVGDNKEWWSDELYRICGYEPNAISPTFDTFAKMLHPDDADRVAALIQQAFTDRQPFNFEHRIIRPDGDCRTLMARCRVVVNNAGVVVRMVGTAQDVTDWKRLQEELHHAQKMEAVGRLADGIAHEFNNLLTIIGGYTHAALSKLDEDSAVASDLRHVRNASTSAAALTRQLLMLKGPLTGQRAPVDLNTLISELERLLRRTLGEQIQIITSLPKRVQPVLGDAGQIRQAIMNLAVNARDAMPRGGTLTIETRTGEPPLHDTVEVIVSDTGRGMDAATQAHIFEPLFTTKATGQRSGFGLFTVYGIVQNQGGTITVDSAPGRGTAFTIRLRSTPKTEAIEPVPQLPSGATSGGTETILLVEDDHSVRELTARLLREAGYRVLEAPSSNRALALVKDTAIHIDLLLIDVMLPGLNGVELFDALRGSRGHVRGLYMTG